MIMEGLLRKYKISKISDNVSLTEKELKICEHLDNLIGLDILKKRGVLVFIYSGDNIIMEYNIKYCSLYVTYDLFWEFLESDLKMSYNDVRVVIKNWVEEIYKLKLNNIDSYSGRRNNWFS